MRNFGMIESMELVISLALLFVGFAFLVVIHVCIARRAFGREVIVQRRSGTATAKLSTEDLNRLPSFEYTSEEKVINRDVDCVVCLENFKVGDQCRVLPNCNHRFHAHCIDSWLLKTAVCPICRTNITPPEDGPNIVGEDRGRTTGDASVELTQHTEP